jgi:hypothetical protein
MNERNYLKTYSPCKTIISSISTFLFTVLVRGVERIRFVDGIRGAAGLGLTFKAEEFLPAGAATNYYQPQSCSQEKQTVTKNMKHSA